MHRFFSATAVALALAACSSSALGPGVTPLPDASMEAGSTVEGGADAASDATDGALVDAPLDVARDTAGDADAGGATLRAAGQEDDVSTFRSTGVTHALDPDGDGVYGTAGYLLYAVGDPLVSPDNEFAETEPLAYASPAGFSTLRSVPAYLAVTSNGMDTVAAGFDYPLVDDPREPRAASVPDVESGLALHNLVVPGREASLLDLEIGVGAPRTLRVGVMIHGAGEDAMARARLKQVRGGASEAIAVRTGTPTTCFLFFDITGAAAGDRFSLFMTKEATGSLPNVAHMGLTFD